MITWEPADEGPLYLLENSNTGILRYAQDDSTEGFFRSLFLALRAILDTAEGGHPLPSVLAAFFLLGVFWAGSKGTTSLRFIA